MIVVTQNLIGIKLIDDENLTDTLILIFRDLKFNLKCNSTSLI